MSLCDGRLHSFWNSVAYLPTTGIHSQFGPVLSLGSLSDCRKAHTGTEGAPPYVPPPDSPFVDDPMLLAGVPDPCNITFGSKHPFALWFPGRCSPHASGLLKAPLHRVLGPLASTCARPAEGLPQSVSTHRPSLDCLQKNITILHRLAKEAGKGPMALGLQAWRDLCDELLRPQAHSVTITSADLHFEPLDTNAAVPITNDLFSCPIAPSMRGSPLLHSYGDIVKMIGHHFIGETRSSTEPDSAGSRISYILAQADLAIDQVEPNRPRALLRRLSALHQFLLDSRWPSVLRPNEKSRFRINRLNYSLFFMPQNVFRRMHAKCNALVQTSFDRTRKHTKFVKNLVFPLGRHGSGCRRTFRAPNRPDQHFMSSA